MELGWLEDFLEIVATRNFSTAAAARNLSQSAFSRHIMALESWIGVQLVDRASYPVQLTKAGMLFLPRCQELIRDLYRLRTDCRQQADPDKKLLSFSALHTLAMFCFPGWIGAVEQLVGSVHISMHAADFHDCIEHLSLGKSDFAMAYDHPDGPPVLRAGPFESIKIGVESLVPVSATDAYGQPLFTLSADQSRAQPYLAYAWNDGYVGRIVSLIHSRQKQPLALSTVYESSLAEGIKRMAIAGKGIGWLPLSCVRDAMARGELCQIGDAGLTIEMDVRLFRRQGSASADVEHFWQQVGRAAAFEASAHAGAGVQHLPVPERRQRYAGATLPRL